LASLDGPLLAISRLSASYGRVPALTEFDLQMSAGECVAVLGANGAGKTTLFRALSGIMVRRTGEVLFCGRDIVDAPSHEIVRLGISHVAEGKHLFAPLSVSENLELGALPLLSSRRGGEVDEARRLVFDLFPRLRERTRQLAGTLSGGEQQMLVIGRAIMSRPKLLLLDEPSAGLAPLVIEQMFGALARLKELGLTILLAEQNVALGLRYADRGIVLRLGRVAMCASADHLRTSSEIHRLYLGGEQGA
jgi:branched-chain amino acid transport system ATP-binding protein